MFFNSNDYMQTQKKYFDIIAIIEMENKTRFHRLLLLLLNYEILGMTNDLFVLLWLVDHCCLTFYFQLNFIYDFFFISRTKNIAELTSTDLHINYVDFAFYIIEQNLAIIVNKGK